jgi:ElaB/YqjD/DUF883 family membrane-anchored ribosome-binding protein
MVSKANERAQEELLAEFNALIADTEKLLENTAALAGDEADELRLSIHDSLKRARDTLQLTEYTVRERAEEAVATAEAYVQQNPWQSVGIAAGVGFLLGLLASRR